MYSSLEERPKELQTLIARFMGLRGALHLRARLLRGLTTELDAAYRIGLPWKEIWRALRECGYQGSYPQFCKTCRRLTGRCERPGPKSRANSRDVLPPHGEERAEAQIHYSDETKAAVEEKEKPAWQQQREAVAAKLDREAEEYRQRQAIRERPKLFKNQPFDPQK